jgi:hypothetical protein
MFHDLYVACCGFCEVWVLWGVASVLAWQWGGGRPFLPQGCCFCSAAVRMLVLSFCSAAVLLFFTSLLHHLLLVVCWYFCIDSNILSSECLFIRLYYSRIFCLYLRVEVLAKLLSPAYFDCILPFDLLNKASEYRC